MSSARNKRYVESGKGLYLDIKYGDTVTITYGEEILYMTLLGKSGADKYQISFNGPRSFQIMRPNGKSKDSDT